MTWGDNVGASMLRKVLVSELNAGCSARLSGHARGEDTGETLSGHVGGLVQASASLVLSPGVSR